MQQTFLEFTFDAAHKTTPETPLHGHTFKSRVVLAGERHETYGWSHDLRDAERVIDGLRSRLDHAYLNDIAGLTYPSLENVTAWIWHQLDKLLPGLCRVELWRGEEGRREGCIYSGPGGNHPQTGP